MTVGYLAILTFLPRLSDDGGQPFVVEGEQSSHMAAALLQGRFSSYYQGKGSLPLNSQNPLEESEDQEPPTLKVESVIERAPESARLLVFASNDFVADQTLGLSVPLRRREPQWRAAADERG